MGRAILARWSKKSLSQILYILSGIILIVVCINFYTVVEIKLDLFNIISVHYEDFRETSMMWILSVLLFQNVIFDIVKYLLKKYFPVGIENYEEKYTNILIMIHTIQDILDLVISVYALGTMMISYQIYNDNGIFMQTTWAVLTYIGVGIRFFDSIYFHFYFNNRVIADRWLNNGNR
ncbi:MAG: hypothetical protein Q4C84_00020 [Bacillota bacterium]|nr:hypothetical protein [Bacillota bacterium]